MFINIDVKESATKTYHLLTILRLCLGIATVYDLPRGPFEEHQVRPTSKEIRRKRGIIFMHSKFVSL